MKRSFGVLLAVFFSTSVAAYSGQQEQPPQNGDYAGVDLLNGPHDNQLPLKGQRFRIDNQVDKITLSFFRQPKSKPVILILPDGTKWYDSKHPREKVTWFTDENFDLIQIEKPQPGPWQVIGQLDPRSRIVVVSDIVFKTEVLPNPMFQHERLKVSGTLYNGDKPVDTSLFRQIVNLDVLFISSNNPDYSNFGVKPTRVAQFLDNGKGYDEVYGDGHFTGLLEIDVETGEYIPTFELNTPLYERNFENPTTIVEPLPVTFTAKTAEKAEGEHKVEVSVNDQVVKPGSVAINARVMFPNGGEKTFSLANVENFPATIEIPNLAYGRYVMDLDVFATTVGGREITAKITGFDFIAKEPPPPPPSAAELAAEKRRQEQARLERERIAREKAEYEAMINVIIIVVINIVLIVAAAAGAMFWMKRKKRRANAEKA
ncbi:TIGR03503 family protein [Idiomarina tyrosinivorans]|uniref:TIGR03503 family protein n=1 Tax=Idiomarina tyrosinivorans TaxID=1445662 RepID=A0A432ZM33_9GAMM|nr:TIGR03503 family protein [Idiomarina tyrosinivorans]